jgi:spore germination cell wall hydrolase CwlJ-like protein
MKQNSATAAAGRQGNFVMARLSLASAFLRMVALLSLALSSAVVAAAPGSARAQEAGSTQPAFSGVASLAQPVIQAAASPLAVPMFAATPTDALATPALGDRDRALNCMSMAIAYEAAGQPVEGQQAVGQVILNRMRAARFPKTVCGVVFQGSDRVTGCQFTFTCDGSFRRRLAETTLMTARNIAATVLDGLAPDRVGGATHYHADYVLPYWASSGQRVARIGAHIFYRMPGDAGRTAEAALLTRAEPAMPALMRLSPSRGFRSRHGARLGMALAQATPVAAHSLFAPWGLPLAGQR